MESNSNEVVVDHAGVSRRVVVKSAAWSVPVFAAVGVTPAFAASGRLASSSLLGSRSNKTDEVTFVWSFTFKGAGSPTVASVSPSSNLVLVSGPTPSNLDVTFSTNADGQHKIPAFTATVTLTNGLSQLFRVDGAKVTPNATNVPFTVGT